MTAGERSDRRMKAVLVTSVVVALGVLVGRDIAAGDTVLRLDSTVYRNAITSMLGGGSLYDYELDVFGRQLPFNYPPFAAIVLTPMALLPVGLSQGLWMALQIVLAGVMVWLVLNQDLPNRPPRDWHGWAITLLASVVFLFGAPAAQSLLYGQVSLVVGALVVIDLLAVPPRYRGILTGLAGAIKLIPLVFLPYFLVTRQWRATLNAAAGFVVATGVAFLAMPKDSIRYWSVELFATGRVGELDSLRNKSVLGLLSYWGIGGDHRQLLWLVLVTLLVVAGLWQARRHHLRGEECAAMLVVGVLGGLVSPISWLHHLVWFALVPVYLYAIGGRVWRWVGAAMALVFSYPSPAATQLDEATLPVRLAQFGFTAVGVLIVVAGLPSPVRTPTVVGAPTLQGDG